MAATPTPAPITDAPTEVEQHVVPIHIRVLRNGKWLIARTFEERFTGTKPECHRQARRRYPAPQFLVGRVKNGCEFSTTKSLRS